MFKTQPSQVRSTLDMGPNVPFCTQHFTDDTNTQALFEKQDARCHPVKCQYCYSVTCLWQMNALIKSLSLEHRLENVLQDLRTMNTLGAKLW